MRLDYECFKFLLITVLSVANKTKADTETEEECVGSSQPEYCRFVFPKFTECCTDDVNPDCEEFDEIFEWENSYYVIYRKYIWPLSGFSRKGFPIFRNPAVDTKELTDPQYFPGLGNVALTGFVQAVLVYNDDIYIAVRRSILKYAVDIYMTDSFGRQVQMMNKIAGETHDLFKAKFIDNYLIRTALTIPMNTLSSGLQNMVVAFLSSNKKKVNLVALFNESGSLMDEKKNVNFKTCGSVLFDNDKIKTKYRYILLHDDGYMCQFERDYMDNSFLLEDQKSYKGFKNCIFCWPLHIMVGCPQPFCLRADIDDFAMTVDVESKSVLNYLYRGPYFWRFKANNLPLPFPNRKDAMLINGSSPWQGSPSYIDAAFSVQNLGMEFTYIFKDDKVYIYIDMVPPKKPTLINNEFRTSGRIAFVDTAMYIPNSHTLFLFEGDYIHLFKANFEGAQLLWNPARPPLIAISYNLTGLPGNIDATFRTGNVAVATKENFYYSIDTSNWDTAHNKKVYSGRISFSIIEDDGLFESTSVCSAIYGSDTSEFITLLKLFEPRPADSTTRFKYDSSPDIPLELGSDDYDEHYDHPKKNNKYKIFFIVIGTASAVLILIMLLVISRTFLIKREEQTLPQSSTQESKVETKSATGSAVVSKISVVSKAQNNPKSKVIEPKSSKKQSKGSSKRKTKGLKK